MIIFPRSYLLYLLLVLYFSPYTLDFSEGKWGKENMESWEQGLKFYIMWLGRSHWEGDICLKTCRGREREPICRECALSRGYSKCKGPLVGAWLACWRSSRVSVWLECSEQVSHRRTRSERLGGEGRARTVLTLWVRLENVEQISDIIRLMFAKDHSGCCVDSGPYMVKGWSQETWSEAVQSLKWERMVAWTRVLTEVVVRSSLILDIEGRDILKVET